MPVHVFGIRHHGPGSARSLLKALQELRPDAVLIEGPPEGDPLLSLAANGIEPPVALLIYAPDEPARAVYYPFAVFSPEWQAIGYALQNRIPVRFIDLPVGHSLALAQEEEERGREAPPAGRQDAVAQAEAPVEIHRDPLHYLALAAGYSDGERWWEHMVEERRDGASLFHGITEAMVALRLELGDTPGERCAAEVRRELLREAYMRRMIRAAEREGHASIAVVCGAWHVPALQERLPEKGDDTLLKGLAKIRVEATWIPWTHGRLAYASGYGAGVTSPGWYHHLWTEHDRITVRWLAKTARLLREAGIDVSPAHVIEGVRLAETLAALRDRPLPGLEELNEATRAVLLFGESLPLQLIEERLIIGEELGRVPAEAPMTPLQRDLVQEQKRLRLAAEAGDRELLLDLRKPLDLARSHLLRRLELLGIAWGKGGERARGKGTFKESWRLQWQPELSLRLIEAGIWGTTIAAAAVRCAVQQGEERTDLPRLTALLQKVMYAGLEEAVAPVMQRLQNEAAVAGNPTALLTALPPLAELMRYGDVRRTSGDMVAEVFAGLLARVCVGLPDACVALNEEAAREMLDPIEKTHGAVALTEQPEQLASWQSALGAIMDRADGQGLLRGRCARLLLDGGALAEDEAARRFGFALSPGEEPAQAAGWMEGFLRGSGQILVYDERLWQLIDTWVSTLPAAAFAQLLPLLRRTFATFTAPERRQLGERVSSGKAATASSLRQDDFDSARAEAVLPLLLGLLGLEAEHERTD